jgi:CheY-like chemotaxis protein/HPt (histidine-containing phosphotransfer) domain-containing protein
MMDGSIDFVTKEGAGSSFWFSLPFDCSQELTLKETLAPQLPALTAGSAVLLVTCSETLEEVLASYLGGNAMKVILADSAACALKILGANPAIRLVIHDLAVGDGSSDAELTEGDKRLLLKAEARPGSKPRHFGMPASDYPGLSAAQEAEFEQLVAGLEGVASGVRPAIIALGAGVFNLAAQDIFPNGDGICGSLMKPFRQMELWMEIAKCCGAMPREAVVEIAPSESPDKVMAQTLQHYRKILVAEDNAVMQELALRQLRRLGITADAVSNGVEAVAAAAGGAYSLILMDCQMPEMDGYEATLCIRKEEMKRGGHIPIIAMTASAMKGDRETCLASGMDDYLSKPVGQAELFALLEKWLPANLDSRQDDAVKAPALINGGATVIADVDPDPAANVAAATAPTAPAENNGTPSIDFVALVELYGEDGLKHLLESFTAECHELIDGLQSAIEQNNQSEVARLAHQLKGLAVVMTAPPLAELAKDIELTAKRGEYAMDSRFEQVKNEFSKVEKLIANRQ